MKTLARWWTSPSQRALGLSALGVLVGCAVAGIALTRRIPTPVQEVPPGYAALVNGKGILLNDLVAQLKQNEGVSFDQATPAQRAKALHDMINEELVVQRALVLDLPETTTEVRDEMVMAENAQVAQPALAQSVSDDQLRTYYDAHRDAYTTGGSMNVTDLVLHVGGYANVDQSIAQAETDASEAVFQLRAGADRRYIMNHFGFDNSGKTDGTEQIDVAAKRRLGPRLYEVARAMMDGQVSNPIADSDGVHVLIMDKRIPDQVAAFDSVRGEVYANYREDQARRAAAEDVQTLRRDARIVLAPGEQE